MRSLEHSASFYLLSSKKQREVGNFLAAYENLQQLKNNKIFRYELRELLLALNSAASSKDTPIATALFWQSLAIRILEEEPALLGEKTQGVLRVLKHSFGMLLLMARHEEITIKELEKSYQDILVSLTVDLIADTSPDDQAANLIMILDLHQMSARLAGQEDDPEWYRVTYLDLAEVARTHGLLELQARLCACSSLYADFIKEASCPLLFARQPDSTSKSRAAVELKAFADYLQARRLGF